MKSKKSKSQAPTRITEIKQELEKFKSRSFGLRSHAQDLFDFPLQKADISRAFELFEELFKLNRNGEIDNEQIRKIATEIWPNVAFSFLEILYNRNDSYTSGGDPAMLSR